MTGGSPGTEPSALVSRASGRRNCEFRGGAPSARRRGFNEAIMFQSSSVLPIVCFFLMHWWGCVLMQTLFLHRYASHGMFRLSRGWERTFYFLTYAFQGSSYLVPSGYAYMHRAHHAYSDTDKDPHTPTRFSNVFTMMLDTKDTYHALVRGHVLPEPRFRGYVPTWPE